MKIGDLVVMTMSGDPGSLWLVLNASAGTILVQNVRTNYRSWMSGSAFEVINENR